MSKHPRHSAADTAPILSLSNITLRVKDGSEERAILDDVSLDIRPGEVVGLVGPSGSGKSTLLTVAGCLQRATSGSARLRSASGEEHDLNVAGATGAKIRRNHIGIVFQQPNLLPSLTVMQQLVMMRRLDRVLGWSPGSKKEAISQAKDLLDAVGLADFEDRKVSALSGGQQARVNIARALMNDPELLLADEPTAALDQKTAGSVTRLLMDVTRDRGIATLYITHDLDQLHGADRIITLVDGKIDRDEPAAQARQHN